MILVQPGETTLDAIERTGRTFSVNPLITSDHGPANVAFLYELIGALAAEVKTLRGSPPISESKEGSGP